MRILAISDIHGCLKPFKALLKKINFSKEDQLFLIGDFIDRGLDSKELIDHIWDLQNEGYGIYCLRGNHEQMLLDSTENFVTEDLWLRNGGKETLQSFQAEQVSNIPQDYTLWMQELPLFFEYENYIFVHAGLNFDLPNPLEGFDSMLWIRKWYKNINYQWLKNRIIVHGHTPSSRKRIEEMFSKLDYYQVLDIDGGCVFNLPDLGHLCAVDLTNRKLYFVKRV